MLHVRVVMTNAMPAPTIYALGDPTACPLAAPGMISLIVQKNERLLPSLES